MTPENFMDENLEKRFEQLADERIENRNYWLEVEAEDLKNIEVRKSSEKENKD